MAWTVLSDATLEVGKALRALTMRNLRDNFAALANGDAGAPQIQTAAIAAGVVTNAKMAANSVAAGNIYDGNVTTAKIADGNVTSGKLATGANEINWVLGRTAGAGTGAVGTYAFLLSASGTGISAGSSYSGLTYAGVRTTPTVTGTGSAGGTWLAMGSINATSGQSPATVFLRIA